MNNAGGLGAYRYICVCKACAVYNAAYVLYRNILLHLQMLIRFTMKDIWLVIIHNCFQGDHHMWVAENNRLVTTLLQ